MHTRISHALFDFDLGELGQPTSVEAKLMDDGAQKATDNRNAQNSCALDEAEEVCLDIFDHGKELARVESLSFNTVCCREIVNLNTLADRQFTYWRTGYGPELSPPP